MGSGAKPNEPQEPVEQDAAMAAGDLYKILQHGEYRTLEGHTKAIAGDLTKLRFAVGITPQQERLLADFRFRTQRIPGCQEIRTKIGHV